MRSLWHLAGGCKLNKQTDDKTPFYVDKHCKSIKGPKNCVGVSLANAGRNILIYTLDRRYFTKPSRQ